MKRILTAVLAAVTFTGSSSLAYDISSLKVMVSNIDQWHIDHRYDLAKKVGEMHGIYATCEHRHEDWNLHGDFFDHLGVSEVFFATFSKYDSISCPTDYPFSMATTNRALKNFMMLQYLHPPARKSPAPTDRTRTAILNQGSESV